jgi:hypothetical protein
VHALSLSYAAEGSLPPRSAPLGRRGLLARPRRAAHTAPMKATPGPLPHSGPGRAHHQARPAAADGFGDAAPGVPGPPGEIATRGGRVSRSRLTNSAHPHHRVVEWRRHKPQCRRTQDAAWGRREGVSRRPQPLADGPGSGQRHGAREAPRSWRACPVPLHAESASDTVRYWTRIPGSTGLTSGRRRLSRRHDGGPRASRRRGSPAEQEDTPQPSGGAPCLILRGTPASSKRPTANG